MAQRNLDRKQLEQIKNRMDLTFAAEYSARGIRERRAKQGDDAPALSKSQKFLLDSFPEHRETPGVSKLSTSEQNALHAKVRAVMIE